MTIAAFLAANQQYPVIKTELISRQRGGAAFTLSNGETFRLDAMDISCLPASFPITRGNGDVIVEPPLNPDPVPIGIPDTEEDYSL